MKKILFTLLMSFPLMIFSAISFDEKIEFIVKEEMPADAMDQIRQAAETSMEFNEMDIPEDFMEILQPVLDDYYSEFKNEMITVYQENFTEEEIDAYYQFISTKAGKSYLNKRIETVDEIVEISFSLMRRSLNKFNNALIRKHPELFEDLYE